MKETKTVTGTKSIVKSTSELRVGDFVKVLKGYTKKMKRTFSMYGYPITEIIDDKVIEVEVTDLTVDGAKAHKERFTVDNIRLVQKTLVEAFHLTVHFTCREAGNQSVNVDPYDFDHDDSPCDLCGSHGHLSVDVECKCGKTHSIELKSW